MRIRIPFAAAFLVILALSAFGGLLPHSSLPSTPAAPFAQSDKVLHVVTFFALTATFYFILDTARRRILHLTLFVCTLVLGVGSEVIQGFLPNDHVFDPYDILANVVGSLAAVGLATLYQKRAAERRRKAKYNVLAGAAPQGEEDLELGEGPSLRRDGETKPGQENGIVDVPAKKTVEQELDNWDENVTDEAWDEDDTTGENSTTKITPASSSMGDEVAPKKVAVD